MAPRVAPTEEAVQIHEEAVQILAARNRNLVAAAAEGVVRALIR